MQPVGSSDLEFPGWGLDCTSFNWYILGLDAVCGRRNASFIRVSGAGIVVYVTCLCRTTYVDGRIVGDILYKFVVNPFETIVGVLIVRTKQ